MLRVEADEVRTVEMTAGRELGRLGAGARIAEVKSPTQGCEGEGKQAFGSEEVEIG